MHQLIPKLSAKNNKGTRTRGRGQKSPRPRPSPAHNMPKRVRVRVPEIYAASAAFASYPRSRLPALDSGWVSSMYFKSLHSAISHCTEKAQIIQPSVAYMDEEKIKVTLLKS